MGQELKISFDTPEHGWLAIYLDSRDYHLKLPFSYTPFDFVSEQEGFHRDFPEKEMRLLTEKMTAIKQQVRE